MLDKDKKLLSPKSNHLKLDTLEEAIQCGKQLVELINAIENDEIPQIQRCEEEFEDDGDPYYYNFRKEDAVTSEYESALYTVQGDYDTSEYDPCFQGGFLSTSLKSDIIVVDWYVHRDGSLEDNNELRLDASGIEFTEESFFMHSTLYSQYCTGVMVLVKYLNQELKKPIYLDLDMLEQAYEYHLQAKSKKASKNS